MKWNNAEENMCDTLTDRNACSFRLLFLIPSICFGGCPTIFILSGSSGQEMEKFVIGKEEV